MLRTGSRGRRRWVAFGVRVLCAITMLHLSLGVRSVAAFAAQPAPLPPPAPPKAWILVDAGSGAVLDAQNQHVAMPPASTVKLITALVALEKLPKDAVITVSPRAAERPAMRIGLRAGEKWPLLDLLHSLLMVSANDAAYALAEAASGSVEAFAVDMATTARRLGMKDSTFNDPAGLDDADSFNGGSLISTHDLAIMARNVLAVKQLAPILRLSEYRFTGPDGIPHVLTNHNKLLNSRPYEGAIGMKTGRTSKAGSTLVAAARRDGRTLIAVVLNAGDIYGSATALLDKGFAMPRNARGSGEVLPKLRPLLAPSQPATPAGAASRDANNGPASKRASEKDGDAGLLRYVALVPLFIFALLVGLRRRAVMRRRRQRAARQRWLADAQRRGSLNVVDTSEPTQQVQPVADATGTAPFSN